MKRMTELAAENWKRRIKMDILAIAVALGLQDLPFFCLRMTLIFRHVYFSGLRTPKMQLIIQNEVITIKTIVKEIEERKHDVTVERKRRDQIQGRGDIAEGEADKEPSDAELETLGENSGFKPTEVEIARFNSMLGLLGEKEAGGEVEDAARRDTDELTEKTEMPVEIKEPKNARWWSTKAERKDRSVGGRRSESASELSKSELNNDSVRETEEEGDEYSDQDDEQGDKTYVPGNGGSSGEEEEDKKGDTSSETEEWKTAGTSSDGDRERDRDVVGAEKPGENSEENLGRGATGEEKKIKTGDTSGWGGRRRENRSNPENTDSVRRATSHSPQNGA